MNALHILEKLTNIAIWMRIWLIEVTETWFLGSGIKVIPFMHRSSLTYNALSQEFLVLSHFRVTSTVALL